MNAKQRRKQKRVVRRLITTDKLVALRVQQVDIRGVYAFVRDLAPNAPWLTRVHLADEIIESLGLIKNRVHEPSRFIRWP